MTETSTERIGRLSDLGVGLIELQFQLASSDARDSLKDFWVLGYCFGMFDALVQRGNLDQYTEGMVLLTVGFARLLDDDQEAGASVLNVALDSQEIPLFVAGNKIGGEEVFRWLANTKKPPMKLFNHLNAR